MKVLIVGIENNGAVSKIMKETIKLFPNNVDYDFYGCGFGENYRTKIDNSSFIFFKLARCKDFMIRIRNKLLKFLRKNYHLIYWKSIYKKTKNLMEEIKPDLIVSVAGPFSYMKAGFELAKKYNKPLVLIFFDPFKDNYKILDNRKAVEEAKKWCDYAFKIFYDADTNEPIDGIKTKLIPFLIPIFESQKEAKRTNTIIYGGSFYKGFREPSILANFINKQKNNNVNYKVFTGKKDSEIIKKMLINKTVEFYEPIDESLFNEVCNESLGIITIGNANQNATIPSKVLEAIGHRKPIIGLNFYKKLYYIDKYPFFFDGDKNDVIDEILKIDSKSLLEYNIFKNFPERNPNLFVNKLIDVFKEINIKR